jgi:hypothetical protein
MDETRPSLLDGYYEGSTDEGDEVAFLVPDRSHFIAHFKAELKGVLITSEGGDDPGDTLTFKIADVGIQAGGTFLDSREDEPFLLAINGRLLPGGRGACISVLNTASGEAEVLLTSCTRPPTGGCGTLSGRTRGESTR